MASVVGVCNRALQKLGTSSRIVSLSDDSKHARALNASYEAVRDALLRDHAWNFAKKRVQLAASATTPDFGKANAFPLPANFLRLLAPDPGYNLNSHDWEIENHEGALAILSDDDAPIDVRYIERVTDPNLMDALFLELWATDLAFELCKEITGSNAGKEALRADRKRILSDAKRTNAIENVASQPPDDPWVTVRK